MGLFLTTDGHFQGWLAALLCCCAVSQDESPHEKERERSKPSTQLRICNMQPLPLVELPATPVPTALLQTRAAGSKIDDAEQRHTHGRAPSIKPLDFGEGSLLVREPHRGRKRSQFGHAKGPSISVPYAFRRLDASEPQRQGLVPLRLGPVILKDSQAPPSESTTTRAMMCRERSDSMQNLLAQTPHTNDRSQRETPYERCLPRSPVAVPSAPPEMDAPAKSLKRSASAEDQRSVRRSMSTKRSSSSLQSYDAHHTAATLFPYRQSADRPVLRRKGSFQIRKPFSESGDVDTDKEILELNTIVEERRAEAARENRDEMHVPAIAPFMHVNARSETLDAIGSALGRPLTAQGNYRPTRHLQAVEPRTKVRRSLSASSRVSGWLSGMVTSHSVAHPPTSEPFYKCQVSAAELRRSRSGASAGTYLTDMDSPSLTAASSPTSKGHSRSQTGESRITPLSPCHNYGGHGCAAEKMVELPWPTSPTSAVGLAL